MREYDIPYTTELAEIEREDICISPGSHALFEIFTIFVNNVHLRANVRHIVWRLVSDVAVL